MKNPCNTCEHTGTEAYCATCAYSREIKINGISIKNPEASTLVEYALMNQDLAFKWEKKESFHLKTRFELLKMEANGN
jgi:hypothetical protein